MLPLTQKNLNKVAKYIRMQIITKFSSNFNTPDEIIIFGPNEIPVGHKLYGRKISRHGTYRRSLILFSGVRVVIVIFRFCEKTATGYVTYSLLPFFISPYQRHVNTVIDRVLQLFFLEHKSMSSISNVINIELTTIRQWISKFAVEVENFDIEAEKIIIDTKPGYRTAAGSVNRISEVVKSFFRKVFYLVADKFILVEYGLTSWINLRLKPFLGKLNNISSYA